MADPLVAALSQAVDQIHPCSWVYGTHDDMPPARLSVQLEAGGSREFAFPMPGAPAPEALLAPLVQAASAPAAAAGPSTAAARTLAIAAGRVEMEGFELDDIVEKARRALVPEAPSIRAELVELSVTTPNTGVQRPSFDSVTSASSNSRSCFGVLEVVLPTPFQDGDCNLSHGTATTAGRVTYRLGGSIWPRRTSLRNARGQASLLHADAAVSDGDEEEEEALEPVDEEKAAAAGVPGAGALWQNPVAQQLLSIAHTTGRPLTAPLQARPGEAPEELQQRQEAAEARAQKHAKALEKKRKKAAAEADEKERVAASKCLLWVAHFGDVQRTVGTVTGCPRVSLVYALHRTDHVQASSSSAGSHALLQRCKNLQRALVSALDSPAFMPSGGKLGIHFRHGPYAEGALAKTEEKLNEGGKDACAVNLPLKEEDSAIAAVVATTGLDIKIVRLATKEAYRLFGAVQQPADEEAMYVMPKMPTKKDAQDFGHRGMFGGKVPGCSLQQLERASTGKIGQAVGEVTWVGSHDKGGQEWCCLYSARSYSGIFGAGRSGEKVELSSALVCTVPPLAQRPRARPTLTVAHVQPFKTVAAKGNKRKGKAAAKGRGAAKRQKKGGKEEAKGKGKGRGKKKAGSDEEDDASDFINDTEEEEEEGDEEEEEEDAEMERQAGRLRRRGEDEEEEEEQEEEDEGSDGGGGRSLAAPPVLFRPEDTSVMTAAQKRVAAMQTVRKIHVSGGRGKNCDRSAEGSDMRKGIAVITLQPGQVLKELKASIRKTFGKVVKTKVGPLMLLDANGKATASQAKTEDLVDGARVECTYTAAEGGFGYMAYGFGYD